MTYDFLIKYFSIVVLGFSTYKIPVFGLFLQILPLNTELILVLLRTVVFILVYFLFCIYIVCYIIVIGTYLRVFLICWGTRCPCVF